MQTANESPGEVASSANDVSDKAIAKNHSIRQDLVNVVRGFCMGAADTVPGVSGGTVALILGHYKRLVTSISSFDADFLRKILGRDIKGAAEHIDFRFLFALGIGIATGIVTLAGLMHWLLDHKQPETYAVFFGLIVASIWVVRVYVDRWSPSRIAACLVGVAIALTISFLPMANGNTSLPFLFVSASIAICAMILPGISGAFVLLLLGVYHPVTGMIKDAAKGNFTSETILQIGVFACGCAFGLLAFSRLLRVMLERHQGMTMATLIGLMIGSIAKLWPLQQPTPETAGLESKFRQMQYVGIGDWPTSIVALIALALVAAVAVIAAEKIASHYEETP